MGASEGRAPFNPPGFDKPAETWYQVHGDLNKSSTGRPLLIVHGGPGATHVYLTPLEYLHSKHGVTLVFYDQFGCGNSTRAKEKRLDESFWTPQLFMDEIENLRKHLGIDDFDLLGQSWGGMLGAQYAITQPPHLRRLILSNSPCSMPLWVTSCNEWRALLPKEIDDTIQKYEGLKDYENPEYINAMMEFYKRHVCRQPGKNGEMFAEPVMKMFEALEEDNTVYFTMCGPSEFTVIGTLKDWTVVGQLDKITNPTLVINGEFDEGRAICVEPFARDIKGAKWVTIEGASHCSHIEKTEEYCDLVYNWVQTH